MKIYSTLNKSKVLLPDNSSPINMYVCGVTPYSSSHLGHAMSYIIFDVVRRYLEYKGYTICHVQNFTDIDDKLINQSQSMKTDVETLAQKYISEYFQDMDALNIMHAEHYPLATNEISEIIEMIRILIEKSYAYESKGSVFFRVHASSDYGKLSGRTLEGMLAGARVEADKSKEDPMDFVLWKASKVNEPSWDSPWGPGRPGWHIECSAMSLKYLGTSIDIHGGGHDLIFPHHENEIAQSEAATGVTPFVKIWMHNGLLQMAQDKMSKSIGNLITIREALQDHNSDTIRLFFLNSHYRSPLNYHDTSFKASEKALARLQKTLEIDSTSNKKTTGIESQKYADAFHNAMEDDFNTPQALAALFDLSREINKANDQGESITNAQMLLLELSNILGLFLFTDHSPEHELVASSDILIIASEIKNIITSNPILSLPKTLVDQLSGDNTTTVIQALSNIRTQLRKDKLYELSDLIRLKLSDAGIKLEDSR
jgi:cysteinyl-tRNA synthetase